jgi:hypothetical protein
MLHYGSSGRQLNEMTRKGNTAVNSGNEDSTAAGGYRAFFVMIPEEEKVQSVHKSLYGHEGDFQCQIHCAHTRAGTHTHTRILAYITPGEDQFHISTLAEELGGDPQSDPKETDGLAYKTIAREWHRGRTQHLERQLADAHLVLRTSDGKRYYPYFNVHTHEVKDIPQGDSTVVGIAKCPGKTGGVRLCRAQH